MLIQKLGFTLMRPVGACLLGGVILWQVAEHCRWTNGQVIIHVATPEVSIEVDDAKYWVENLCATPIVCDLRPGRHRVRMLRNGRVLYQEDFSLSAGEEPILNAWDGYTDGRSPQPAD